MPCFPAFPTPAKDGEMIKDGLKLELLTDALGGVRQVAVIQVDHLPATPAHQVVVRPARHDLKLGAAPAQVGLAENAQVTEQLQRAVDGREVHVAPVKRGPIVDLFGAAVPLQLAQGLQDNHPLPCHPHAMQARPVYQNLVIVHHNSTCEYLQLDSTWVSRKSQIGSLRRAVAKPVGTSEDAAKHAALRCLLRGTAQRLLFQERGLGRSAVEPAELVTIYPSAGSSRPARQVWHPIGPRSHPALGPFPHARPAPGPFPAQARRGILCTVKDRANRWAEDPQKGKGEIMKKVLMVIFVLSLLGLMATPMLANVLAESSPYNKVAPTTPGGFKTAGGEKPVQLAIGGGFYSPAPLG